MKSGRFLIVLAAALTLGTSVCHAQQEGHKKVAVVLSGGGAKGMAHIGVLKVIERAGIPVDIVTGTSMGSIVGGLYSIGYTAAQLDSLVRLQDWSFILSDEENLSDQSLEEREKSNTYMLQRSFSLKSKKRLASAGILKGRNLSALFRNLTNGYGDSLSFDSLPRKFACVATDIVTNSEYDFHSGVLAEAMRTSMAIPGVFAPVRKGDMVLVDGGLRNNYPADLARQMGADIIIGATVQGPPKTADDLMTTAQILSQIVDVNCKNKYDDNLAITDIPIRVNTKPYGSASFSSEAIDTLIRRGEEEAMRHWDELLALKAQLGLGEDAKTTIVARQEPQSASQTYKVNRFEFVNMTPSDEQFLRKKFHLTDGDTIDYARAELIASSMRVDLFYEDASFDITKNGSGYDLTFEAGARKTFQIGVGARFDTEEMAAIQIEAEVPLYKRKPLALDMMVRLGRRIKASTELVYHPVSFTKMRLGYLFEHYDVNLYNKGNRAFNHIFNHHRAYLNPAEFNIRNLNVTLGARWDYYHHGELLAGKVYFDNANLQNPVDDHYFSYYANLLYDAEDDPYFPSRGARFNARYGYYTDDFVSYNGHSGFSEVSAMWRMAFSVNRRFVLQPMAYGRLLFGSEIPMVMGNAVGGDFFGHYDDQQMPFAGMGHVEFLENHFVGLQLKGQENFYKNLYFTARVNAALHSNKFDELLKHSMLWGGNIGAYYKSMFGPLGATLGWNNRSESLYFYINLGYEF